MEGDDGDIQNPPLRWHLADGRELLFFALPGHNPAPVTDRRPLTTLDPQTESRFDRQTGQWVVIAPQRQDRNCSPGRRIAAEAWGDGPAVYLVHGWGGCRAHLGVFVKPLVDAGHRVIAFDLPSHNDSEPGDLARGRTTIVECANAVGAMVRAHGPARAIVAHSLGAKAAALAVADGAPAERLVFLAPMGEFSWYLDIFAERHGFGSRIRNGLHRRLDRRLGMPLFDTDIPRVAARMDNPPPLLVVHDPDDPDSPYPASEAISAWPGASLVTTQGLGRLAHYRMLRHRPAIRAGLDFIGQPAPYAEAGKLPNTDRVH